VSAFTVCRHLLWKTIHPENEATPDNLTGKEHKMDTTLAFVVSFGMAVAGQVAQDGEKLHDAALKQRPVDEQSQQRVVQTRKRIALTNEWSRQMRQGGLQRF
jgi:hypothetical protein